MPSSSRDTAESIGSAVVTQEANSGSQLPDVHELRVAGAANEPPQQYSKAQVFALLVEALDSFPPDRRPHPAAGVGARMRHIDPNFTQIASGFSSFRDIVRAAADAQYVRVVASEGRNDVKIDLAPGVSSGSHGAQIRALEHVNDDLWRALINWDTSKTFAYDRELRRPVALSGPPTGSDLLLPVTSRGDQLAWMREFAEAEADADIRKELEAGLATSEPVRGFSAVIRAQKGVDRRWKRHLRTRVLDRATAWAREAGIPLEDLEAAPQKNDPRAGATRTAELTAQDMRGQVLAILEQLPTSELLRLPIPVEYALKR